MVSLLTFWAGNVCLVCLVCLVYLVDLVYLVGFVRRYLISPEITLPVLFA
jgi:hypothetical protein